MPKLGDTARVNLKGSTGVDHRAPLEDLCQEAYRVARALATARGFRAHTHNGPHGPVQGIAGPMVMSRLMRQLYPGFTEDEFKKVNGLISQVLKKTDACVCIKQPNRAGGPPKPEDLPVWFIADTMPENLVIVALSHAKRSADVRSTPERNPFDEDKYLTRRERQLAQADVGEDLPPAEVTVKKTAEPESPAKRDVAAPLRSSLEAVQAQHRELVKRVIEEFETSPIPLTANELATIVNRDAEWDFHQSTYRDAINELVTNQRLVYRKEEDSERALRGGGSMPKGGRMRLFWSAPGPVPVRDRMPAGVQPHRSAAEWELLHRSELGQDMTSLIEILGAPLNGNTNPPRTTGRLAEETGISLDRVKAALSKLKGDGVVYEDSSHRWHLVSNRRSTTPENQPAENLPKATKEDMVMPSPVETPADDLTIVLDLARRLGVQLPKGDDDRVRDLEQTVSMMAEQVEGLTRDNAKLREQVAALRTAIATLS